nr:thaumatin-like protein [Malus domestica]
MVYPVGLQIRSHDNRQVVACKSTCSAFNSPRYCCIGSFGSPQSCKPTAYSKIFKAACPKAYSYAYDDPTSIATCTRRNFLLQYMIPSTHSSQHTSHRQKAETREAKNPNLLTRGDHMRPRTPQQVILKR